MLLFLCLLMHPLARAMAEVLRNTDGIVVLDESTFDGYIKEHARVFVQFCNPWSRHCKATTPRYAELATVAKQEGLAVHLAYVDAGTQGVLVERFAVHKLPGFRYFKHSSGGHIVTEYEGDDTTLDALMQWLRRREDASFDWQGLLETDVVKLGSENFTRFIEAHARVLVNFYSPWCSHCTALAPEYEAAARNLRRENFTTIVAKVDAIEEHKLAKQLQIHSYPTMKYFANGLAISGPDARDSKGITRWLRNRENSMVQFIYTTEIRRWSVGKRCAVMLFDVQSAKRHALMEKVASDLLDDCECQFAVVVPSGEDYKQNGSVMMRRNLSAPDEEFVHFSGSWSRGELRAWIMQLTFPSIGDYDLEPDKYTPHQRYTNSLQAAMVVSSSKQEHKDLRYKIEAYLRKQIPVWKKKRLELAWADSQNSRHDAELLRDLANTPQITLMSAEKGTAVIRKYVLRGQTNLENESVVLEFVDKYFAGRLRPAFKSQPRPNSTSQDFVTILVGDTFEEVAFAEQHDVFVKFYAPWCGQCNKVAPVWKDLARAVHDLKIARKGVIVAEMDSTSNECVEDVPGYPHFVLYPAVKGGARRKMREKIVLTPSRYDVSVFMDFIEENARNLERSEDTGAECTAEKTGASQACRAS